VRGPAIADSPARLYQQDFVRWSEEQAAAHSGANLPLDAANYMPEQVLGDWFPESR
jgi:hypothetical protein